MVLNLLDPTGSFYHEHSLKMLVQVLCITCSWSRICPCIYMSPAVKRFKSNIIHIMHAENYICAFFVLTTEWGRQHWWPLSYEEPSSIFGEPYTLCKHELDGFIGEYENILLTLFVTCSELNSIQMISIMINCQKKENLGKLKCITLFYHRKFIHKGDKEL